jgi:hypothetical protein
MVNVFPFDVDGIAFPECAKLSMEFPQIMEASTLVSVRAPEDHDLDASLTTYPTGAGLPRSVAQCLSVGVYGYIWLERLAVRHHGTDGLFQ